MQKNRYISYILFFSILAGALPLVTSCSDDDEASDNGTVQFGVTSAWQKADLTRALTEPDAPTTPAISYVYVQATPKAAYSSTYSSVSFPIYPAKAGSYTLDDKTGYMQFHTNDPENEVLVKLDDIKKYDYTAKSMFPGDSWTSPYKEPWTSVPAYGHDDYLLAESSDTKIQIPHVLFTLKHQTALIRFVLGVDEDYVKMRDFKLKSIKVYKSNGGTEKVPTFEESSDYEVNGYTSAAGDSLTTEGSLFLSFYVNPALLTGNIKTVKVVAVYDVYDKSGQLSRKDCQASNTLTLNPDNLTKGYYYDILTTIVPDFLYVLSDNDKTSDLELK